MSEYMDQKPEAWNRFASSYEKTFGQLTVQFAQDVLDMLKIQPSESVIDVAAGTGNFTFLAAKTGAEILAVDFSEAMVSLIRETAAALKLSNVRAEVMDGQSLSVPAESFNVSVSILGLVFFPDMAKGFSEMKRVLKPGGRSAVVCFGDLSKFTLMAQIHKAVKEVIPDYQPPAQTVSTRLTGDEALRDEMEKAGFTDVIIRKTTRYIDMSSPQEFWDNFAPTAPPLAELFQRTDPEKIKEIGRAFINSFNSSQPGESPVKIGAEVVIGVGIA